MRRKRIEKHKTMVEIFRKDPKCYRLIIVAFHTVLACQPSELEVLYPGCTFCLNLEALNAQNYIDR